MKFKYTEILLKWGEDGYFSVFFLWKWYFCSNSSINTCICRFLFFLPFLSNFNIFFSLFPIISSCSVVFLSFFLNKMKKGVIDRCFQQEECRTPICIVLSKGERRCFVVDKASLLKMSFDKDPLATLEKVLFSWFWLSLKEERSV